MASIKAALKALYTIEGFKSDHPLDSGGRTTYGISQKYWPRHYKDWGGPPTKYQADVFYTNEFWNPQRLGDVHDPRIAFEVFEQSVNLGRRRAARFLQVSINLVMQKRKPIAVDGRIGRRTITAVNNLGKRDTLRVLAVLNGTQYMYYLYRTNQMDGTLELFRTSEREDQRVFFRGWLKRIAFDV